jgi:predicted DNA binding CopG/RHH family protein
MQRKPTISNELDSFIKNSKDKKIEFYGQKAEPKKENDLSALKRQTYYITEIQIEAIKQMAFYENINKSEIIRKALEQYIPEKYIQLAVKKQ